MARHEKILHHFFNATSLSIDASIESDEIKELEAHVNYESFMQRELGL